MSNQRDRFDLAAADAANIRVAAQNELAEDIANEFMTNPARFDPKRLRALSSKGFLVLLAAVRQHDVHEPEPQRDTAVDPADARTRALSWQHLRKPEPNRWLRGLAAGVGGGLLIIASGLAFATFS